VRPAPRTSPRTRQLGFSLTELMVALVMSLVLLAGALSILYSSRVSYAENEKLARVQETGRTVMELILRDVRASGFNGCARPLQTGDFINDIDFADDEEEALFDFARPIGGYEGTVTAGVPGWTTAGGLPAYDDFWDLAPNSDVLIVRTVREGQPTFRATAEVLSPASLTVPVAFAQGTSLSAGAPVLIADCRGSNAFRVGDFAVTTAATADEPGIADLEFDGGVALSRGFLPGATLVPLDGVVYYVGTGSDGTGTSLWQKIGTADAQELVEGVENIQLQYGVDSTADRVPDSYLAAGAVTNWNNVVSLQIAVLVRSEQEFGSEIDERTYTLLPGTVVGPFNDRRYRSVFTTTIAVRNRAN
jgi:type IV pilus assembly protein PilW